MEKRLFSFTGEDGVLYVWYTFNSFSFLIFLNHEVIACNADGEGKNDGGALLNRNGVESLEIAKLESLRGALYHLGCLLQWLWSISFTLSCNHLKRFWYFKEWVWRAWQTFALASLAASASAAIALCSWRGSMTSFSSTIWTLTPQGSVASSRVSWQWMVSKPHDVRHSNSTLISLEIPSLSDNISDKFLVPNTFLSVVAAKSRVEWL